MTRLQQYMNRELPDVQAGFRKGRGTRDQIANIHWIIEKAREFQKNICFIDYGEAFVWITTNCGKFFKRWEYQTTLLASWEICMQVKKQQLEPDMEQQMVPNWERSTSGPPSAPSNQKKRLPATSEVWDFQLEVELCVWIEDCFIVTTLDIIDGNKISHV